MKDSSSKEKVSSSIWNSSNIPTTSDTKNGIRRHSRLATFLSLLKRRTKDETPSISDPETPKPREHSAKKRRRSVNKNFFDVDVDTMFGKDDKDKQRSSFVHEEETLQLRKRPKPAEYKRSSNINQKPIASPSILKNTGRPPPILVKHQANRPNKSQNIRSPGSQPIRHPNDRYTGYYND